MALTKTLRTSIMYAKNRRNYMNLKEYLFRKDLSCSGFARILDCSRQQVAKARAGHKVSAKFARQIQRETNGLVTVDEILNPKPTVWQDEEENVG
jgi:hypothetical protein